MQILSSTAPPAPQAALRLPWRQRALRALGVVVGIEIGLLLLTLPWTPLWEHCYWLLRLQPAHPHLQRALLSSWMRGAASGLGLVNLWIATSEFARFRS